MGSSLPRYMVVAESGPEHNKRFVISVKAGDVVAEGQGHTKKEAEMDAAQQALSQMKHIKV
ncbi:MAG: hypothetical protein COY40_00580 [Alphaproteobacteria bacterium CG_4_10_14_0_8_um_filter_53_9]|nr:MAG: hypothetical protein COY40_00580 [Alphaproteobacteria bacterium CG_4_10_14_0_8_um_filter_53_9]